MMHKVGLFFGFLFGTLSADVLNVHIVPHSHDDTGWLKTFDEYYLGLDNNIQEACVRCILGNVTEQLLLNPERKFTEVEIAFFSRFFDEQTPKKQEQIRGLVENGQLQFINGGWCMNDEANADYVGIIDQMTLGHEYLRKNFGVTPTVGYSIDPFGHAADQALLYAEMGLEGFIINRVDFNDFQTRLDTKTMEFNWRPSSSIDTEIFTHLTFNHYSPPTSFCFDGLKCDPISNPRITPENAKERSDQFHQDALDQGSFYRTNNIMMLMGEDFQYEGAEDWYTNLDALIQFLRDNPDEYGDINVFYSTPAEYIAAAKAEGIQDITTKTGDFFPYADNADSYWTGYFTSRPAFKGYARETESFMQACKQLDVLDSVTDTSADISVLQDILGVIQHHDAIASTEKQHVNDDYELHMNAGVLECEQRINEALAVFTGNLVTDLSQCQQQNISICDATTDEGLQAVLVFNSLAQERNTPLRIPVPSSSVQVFNSGGDLVESQVLPGDNPYPIEFQEQGTQPFKIVFEAQIPPFGFTTYFLDFSADGGELPDVQDEDTPITLENDNVLVEFDSQTGKLTSITNKAEGVKTEISQDWLYYQSFAGPGQASGAYIFRPAQPDPTQIAETAEITVTKGDVVQEVHQQFGDFVHQVVRLYSNSEFVEIEHTVGPIDISDNIGKEIIMKFETDFQTDEIIFTDSQCRGMEKRQLNVRDTYELIGDQPEAQNYYPLNCATFISDLNTGNRVTVITDRSQGVASLQDGNFEIMIHRRILKDDGRGVGEPLNEPGFTGQGLVTRGSHYIFTGSKDTSSVQHRTLQEELNFPTILAFASIDDSTAQDYINVHEVESSFGKLPENVHLLTLEKRPEEEVIVRFAHIFEEGEDPEFATTVSVNLEDALPTLDIGTVQEFTLNVQLPLSDVVDLSDFGPIEMSPMKIRTFILTLNGSTERSTAWLLSGVPAYAIVMIIFGVVILVGGIAFASLKVAKKMKSKKNVMEAYSSSIEYVEVEDEKP